MIYLTNKWRRRQDLEGPTRTSVSDFLHWNTFFWSGYTRVSVEITLSPLGNLAQASIPVSYYSFLLQYSFLLL